MEKHVINWRVFFYGDYGSRYWLDWRKTEIARRFFHRIGKTALKKKDPKNWNLSLIKTHRRKIHPPVVKWSLWASLLLGDGAQTKYKVSKGIIYRSSLVTAWVHVLTSDEWSNLPLNNNGDRAYKKLKSVFKTLNEIDLPFQYNQIIVVWSV